MKNIVALTLVTLAAAACAKTSDSTTDSSNTLKKQVIAICKNKFFGGESKFIGHIDSNGELRNVETENLELVQVSGKLNVSEGVVTGPRYASKFSSGKIVKSTAAGRNLYFDLTGNGGLLLEKKWGATMPLRLVIDSTNEELKSISMQITYKAQHDGKYVEELALIEDCTIPTDVRLIIK